MGKAFTHLCVSLTVVVLAASLLVATDGSWKLPVPSGLTVGDLLYAGRGFELTNLNAVATGRVLISKGTGTAPAYSATPAVNLVEVTKGMRGDQEPQAGATGAMQDGFKIYASRVQGLTVLYAVFATGIPHPFATQWN